MPFLSSQMDDYVRRLGIHAAADRPCSARSLTEEEARAWDRSDMSWRVILGLGAMIVIFSPALMNPNGRELWPWLAGGLAIILAVLALTWWQKKRRRRGYRDPKVSVEVADDGLIFATPPGASPRSWTEVEVVELLSTASRSSRSFDGIVLGSPIGPIRLEDAWYSDGRKVAGAVLKRLDEVGIAVPTR